MLHSIVNADARAILKTFKHYSAGINPYFVAKRGGLRPEEPTRPAKVYVE